MRAIRVHACGGPEALRYDEVPVPEPQAGEALVEIAAAGVNFIDVQHRAGRYKPPALPFTLGSEAAGTVTAVGAGVSEVAVGDRVAYAMVLGAYAEYAVVPAKRLVKVPAAIDFQTAAAVMLQGLTAHYLTHSTYRDQSGRHGARARGRRRRGPARSRRSRGCAARRSTARSAAKRRPPSRARRAPRRRSTIAHRTSRPRSRSSRTAAASTSSTTPSARTRSTRA